MHRGVDELDGGVRVEGPVSGHENPQLFGYVGRDALPQAERRDELEVRFAHLVCLVDA